jgi:beta-mannosidase
MNSEVLNLNGKWLFKKDPKAEFEAEGIQYQKLIETEWKEIKLPAHWQTEDFDYQGTAWFYKRFNIANFGKNIFLEFEKVDYRAEIWLNGVYLGYNEGDFNSFAFEISEQLKKENHLLLKVESGIDSRPEFKKIIKGGVYHWDCLPIKQQGLKDCPEVPSAANDRYPNPIVNPGGIWGAVKLKKYKQLRIEKSRYPYFFTEKLGQEKNNLFLKPEVEIRNLTGEILKTEIVFIITPLNFSGESFDFKTTKILSPGINKLNFSLELNNIKRWWSRNLGDQNIYQLELKIYSKEKLILEQQEKIAFREVEIRDGFSLYLNGIRFYARGVNYLSSQFLSKSDKSLYDQDFKLILDAEMNMIRVFSHLENEYFYQLCDELGILIWQDLPLQWGYDNQIETIEKAVKITEKAVEKLFDHPSVFNWCVHSESRYHDYIKMDRVLENKIKDLDHSRPVWRNSVFMTDEKLPEFFKSLEEFEEYNANNLSVNWVGWYWDQIENADNYNPLFITEFGSQSLPNRETMTKIFNEDQLWPPDWKEWKKRGFQKEVYQQNIGYQHESLEEIINCSQAYQTYFYKEHVEAMRRKKYNKNNGILAFHLVSTWPALDWSLVDHLRKPKMAYFALKESYQPLLASFRIVKEDEKLILEGWLINDYQQSFNKLELKYELDFDIGSSTAEFKSIFDLESDCAKRIIREEISSNFKTLAVQSSLFSEQGKILAQNKNLLFNKELEFTFGEKCSQIELLWGGE